MELFIEGITENIEEICGSSENRKDISEWEDVCTNDSDEVTLIYWGFCNFAGNISLQWLPLSVQKVNLRDNFLTGTADLTRLPDGLELLFLFNNRFDGTVDLTNLPEKMRTLYLYENNFSGKADFSQLPKSLTDLDVSSTQIEGVVYAFEGNLETRRSNVKDMREN